MNGKIKSALLASACLLPFLFAPKASAQGAATPQACQWNYAMINGVATATYCGVVATSQGNGYFGAATQRYNNNPARANASVLSQQAVSPYANDAMYFFDFDPTLEVIPNGNAAAVTEFAIASRDAAGVGQYGTFGGLFGCYADGATPATSLCWGHYGTSNSFATAYGYGVTGSPTTSGGNAILNEFDPSSTNVIVDTNSGGVLTVKAQVQAINGDVISFSAIPPNIAAGQTLLDENTATTIPGTVQSFTFPTVGEVNATPPNPHTFVSATVTMTNAPTGVSVGDILRFNVPVAYGYTTGIQFAAGGEAGEYALTPEVPVSTAITVSNHLTSFRKGFVFYSNAISPYLGVSNVFEAMEMYLGDQLGWASDGTGTLRSKIRSDANGASGFLDFTNGGVNFDDVVGESIGVRIKTPAAMTNGIELSPCTTTNCGVTIGTDAFDGVETSGSFGVYSLGNSPVNVYSITGVGYLEINAAANNANPSTALSGTTFQTDGSDSLANIAFLHAFGNSSQYLGSASGGTRTAPTALAANSIMVTLGARGYNGSAYPATTAARINFDAAPSGANWTTSDNGALIDFLVTAKSTVTPARGMVLNGDGSLYVGASGTPGDDGAGSIVSAGSVRTACYTVATLPPTNTAGRRACVSDQTATCPTNGGAFTGSGSVTCPAFNNGSAWVGG
jgi:hypothetical protein